MTRPLRIAFPGAIYHVMSRGDCRRDIYRDDIDRRFFLDLLAREVRQQRWRLLAYCLMGNHYHLLLETPESNLVPGMRRLNGVYSQTFNRRHAEVGHVMQGRYKSVLVDREAYLLELARYIVLNPVRAGMVSTAQEWAWSSFRATAGFLPTEDWLACDLVLLHFGEKPPIARKVYQDFVLAGVDAPSPWAQLRGQIYLGRKQFLVAMAQRAAAQACNGISRSQLKPARPAADEVLRGISTAFGIEPDQVRCRQNKEAFQAWVYLLRRAANLTLRNTAQLAGVSPGRVSQIQTQLECRDVTPVIAKLMQDYKV